MTSGYVWARSFATRMDTAATLDHVCRHTSFSGAHHAPSPPLHHCSHHCLRWRGQHSEHQALRRRGHLGDQDGRSEEHTSELQSRSDLVCRLLLEKKKTKHIVRCIRMIAQML